MKITYVTYKNPLSCLKGCFWPAFFPYWTNICLWDHHAACMYPP